MVRLCDEEQFRFTQKQIDALFEITLLIEIRLLGRKYNQTNFSLFLKEIEEHQLV